MKLSSKIISVTLSAMMLFSCSAAIANAAGVKKQAKVIQCSGANCGSIQELVKKLCRNNGCKTDCFTKKISGYCPGGNCVTKTPSTPSAAASQPADEASSSEFNTSFESEVVRLVNEERTKNGLKALKQDDGAVKAAHVRAKEIVKNFSHTRPDGTSCFSAAQELGVSYRSAGENIAYGYSTPKQVVAGWMNSDGHRKNILSTSFTKIGVGCYENGGTLYWSQFFIG